MDWDGESALWLQCFYGAVGGMLLRLSDIKRKQKGFFTQAIRGFFLVTLVFAYCLPQGLLDPLVLCGLVAGGLVVYYPSRYLPALSLLPSLPLLLRYVVTLLPFRVIALPPILRICFL